MLETEAEFGRGGGGGIGGIGGGIGAAAPVGDSDPAGGGLGTSEISYGLKKDKAQG